MDDELLTIAEVARRLRVDPSTVRRWIKQGSLPAVHLPFSGTRHSCRILRSTLDTIVPPVNQPAPTNHDDPVQ